MNMNKAVIFAGLPLTPAEIKKCQQKARELGYEPEDEVMELKLGKNIPLLEQRIKSGEVVAVVLPVWGEVKSPRELSDPSLAESIEALGARLIFVKTM